MSDQHPRPWQVSSFRGANTLLDANGHVVKTYGVPDSSKSALDLIVAAVNAYSPWIGVEERLPAEKGDYLVFLADPVGTRRPQMVMLFDPQWGWDDHDDDGLILISHWMPLLVPPSL